MTCPVCSNPGTVRQPFAGSDFIFETTRKKFAFSGCGRCHCLFLDPPPGAEEMRSFYPAPYWWSSASSPLKKLESIYRRIALRDHVSFIRRTSQSLSNRDRPARLLDVGCGSGTLLGLLKKDGFDVVGFDASRQAAAMASAESGVKVLTGAKLHDGNFGDSAFDVITLFHVMEHVSEPRDVLAEVRRILHAQGRIVVQVPNIESWQFKLCGMSWYGLDVPRHVINYSGRSLRKLLSETGFRVCRTRHFNLRDNAPALASSLFPSLDPVSRRARRLPQQRPEPPLAAWLRHAGYLAALGAAYPFAIAEAICGAGGTVMVEAEKIPS